MFRASPWISYDPQNNSPLHPPLPTPAAALETDPVPDTDMDAPEISTLREEEEETPPPDAARLSFSKFRVNLRMPARGQLPASSGSVVGPPVGPPPVHRRAPSLPDSDDEEEEDQLIDDDELAIVTETGRAPVESSGSLAGSPDARKRAAGTRVRQRRAGPTGRRGRPGREPPDAAAMMSTFELAKTEAPNTQSALHVSPPAVLPVPLPQLAGPSASTSASASASASLSAGDWSSTAPPKPPRKKPGPKKGSTLGPRGPRKNAKNSQLPSGRGTPVDDTLLPTDPSPFLIPAPPSIPPTPGSDQPSLPQTLPTIPTPDLTLDPTIPVPVYSLPTRIFPVQPPPKIPTGYATTHPLDPHSGPPRKWRLAQREIKGIAGGRWFARCWVGEKEKETPELFPPPSTLSMPVDDKIFRTDDLVQLPPPESQRDTSAEPESPPRSPEPSILPL